MPHDQIYAPDGRTWYETAIAEAEKRGQLQAVLYEVTTNGEWTKGDQAGDWAISKEVYETVRDAIAGQSKQDGLRAALIQIRGFVEVMEPNNWRDLRLHIERQCNVIDGQSMKVLRQCPGCGREEPHGTDDICPYCDVRYDCED